MQRRYLAQNQALPAQIKALRGLLSRLWAQQLLLFAICFVVLLRTMTPTVYSYDSGEFAIGAAHLGIVHAPGYPLYLLIAHAFTWLPFGDIAYRVNLLSALALALTAPFLYALIAEWLQDRWVALCSTLVFSWSFYVWQSGLRAEIYAPQMATIALAGWMLVLMYRRKWIDTRHGLIMGALFGFAVAMAPVTGMLTPGLVVSFLLLRIPLRRCIYAGLLSFLIFACAQLYFPIRYTAQPILNLAGQYDAQGTFQQINLTRLDGILWLLRGEQFTKLFAAVSTTEHVTTTLSWFWSNYLGIGIVLGLLGIVVLWRSERGFLLAWLMFFLPVTYFFTAYLAADRDSMFGQSYLLWSLVFACGLKWVLEHAPRRIKTAVTLVVPLLFLVINFPLLDISHDTSIRDHAEALIEQLPQNSLVFGGWFDIVPLQYVQMVEGKRPDVKLRNLILFNLDGYNTYMASLATTQTPIVMVGDALPLLPAGYFSASPIILELPSYDGSGTKRMIAGFKLDHGTTP